MFKPLICAMIALVAVNACNPKKTKEEMPEESKTQISVSTSSFGQLPTGEDVTKFTITNANGMVVSIINYGGIITDVMVPDKNGKLDDVVLGFDHLEGYLGENPYFGAIIGRYGNRIAKGKFTLEGKEYTLAVNNGENHLHGGLKGFDKVIWNAEMSERSDHISLKLTYLSKHMEEGYPGSLNAEVTYTINNDNEIKIDYNATTDQTTVVNLTNHSYFNLGGAGAENILNHELMMKADNYVPVDAGLIPTGELMPVAGTPFDFNSLTKVGERINDANEQIELGGGYDHCWVFNKSSKNVLDWVIKVVEPKSGRTMEVATTEPAVQFYSGNFLDGSIAGKNGKEYPYRYAMCFETEHYPDSPNQPQFPSTELKPGETYSSTTIYKFSTVNE